MDLFSGLRAPVAAALAWCGWKVTAVDILLDKRMDLADLSFQAEIRPVIRQADAAFWAPDCATFTRARERPIPSVRHAPRPLRSAQMPRGLLGVSLAEQRQVVIAPGPSSEKLPFCGGKASGEKQNKKIVCTP